MKHIIIGNGGAGIRAAEAIRLRDAEAAITIIDNEPYRSYYRMMLPDFISGWKEQDSVYAVPETYYSDKRIEFLPDTHVSAVDGAASIVTLASGEILPFDSLLIASGAHARMIDAPGTDLEGVVTLRTMDDALNILKQCEGASGAVTLGGGLLGVELARCFRERGLASHYLIREDRFWPQMLDAAGSGIVERLLSRKEVMLATEETITEIRGSGGKVAAVVTSKGRELEAQVVGISVGVTPRIDYLQGSGLELNLGIRVDDHMRTNVPNVFAAGDVAEAFDVVHQEHRINTSYMNARRQGEVAGINMAGGDEAQAGTIPFNLIRIYGLSVTCMGLSLPPDEGYDVFTGPYPEGDQYKKLVLKDDVLVGATLIGDVKEATKLEELIKKGVKVGEGKEKLMGGDFDLGELLKKSSR